MKKQPESVTQLIRRALALCEVLGVRTSEDQTGGRIWIDLGLREPGSWLDVARDGRCWLCTCEYSGHNGDSYGHKERLLGEEEAMRNLLHLCSGLEAKALAAEERRLEEAARRRRTEVAKQNLTARLRNKGVL